MIKTVLKVDSINSTSEYLKDNYRDFPSGTILVANFQTNGHGQFDRVWQSQKGQNILMSILLKDIDIDRIEQIKKRVLNTIISFLDGFEIKASFKAPNDIYFGDKKLCGILIENLIMDNQYAYIVIGIGLNVNQRDFEQLNATSMALIKHKTFQLDRVLNQFIDHITNQVLLCC